MSLDATSGKIHCSHFFPDGFINDSEEDEDEVEVGAEAEAEGERLYTIHNSQSINDE